MAQAVSCYPVTMVAWVHATHIFWYFILQHFSVTRLYIIDDSVISE
jgi:hypothetical protein